MRVETSNFLVCDDSYEQLNTSLNLSRENYQSGQENYKFYQDFEDLIYKDKKYRRTPKDEIQRLSSFLSSEITGKFDSSTYTTFFQQSYFTQINHFLINLMGKGQTRNDKIYSQKNNLKALLEFLIYPIEEKIQKVLDSNFVITKCEELTTFPGAYDKSYDWHFDPVPLGFGKIFFYLSDHKVTDGRTYYLSFQDSLEFLKNGYNNVPVDQRFSDKDFTNCNKVKEAGQQGQWLMFFPGSMLHRGGYPKVGVRRIFAVNFLRSNLYWRDHIDELIGIDSLSGRWIASNWPSQK